MKTPLMRPSDITERDLMATDLGLKENTLLAVLAGTVFDTGTIRIIAALWIEVDTLSGDRNGLLPQLRSMFPNIVTRARADRVTQLWILAFFANQKFQRFVMRETRRLGGRYIETGLLDLMLFERPLAGI